MTEELHRPEGRVPSAPDALGDPFASLGFDTSERSTAPVLSASPESTSSMLTIEALPPLSRRAIREAEAADAPRRRDRREEARGDAPGRRTRHGAGSAPAARSRSTAVEPIAPSPASRPHQHRAPLARRIAKKALPPAVMVAVAALLVGTSVPANALFDPETAATAASLSAASIAAGSAEGVVAEGQVLEMEADAEAAATAATRDEWTVTSYAELLRLKYGNRDYSYSTTGTGAVRWPFPYAVPIASGFGERSAPCRWCSSYHQGLDFNPGAGAPIYVIADGVVLQSEYSGGFGQHAIIEHVINGQKVTSAYAHMIGGSSPLVPGQQVRVGDFVGLVGSTGTSTGAHLHFEIRLDGVAIDPFAWLSANAS